MCGEYGDNTQRPHYHAVSLRHDALRGVRGGDGCDCSASCRDRQAVTCYCLHLVTTTVDAPSALAPDGALDRPTASVWHGTKSLDLGGSAEYTAPVPIITLERIAMNDKAKTTRLLWKVGYTYVAANKRLQSAAIVVEAIDPKEAEDEAKKLLDNIRCENYRVTNVKVY